MAGREQPTPFQAVGGEVTGLYAQLRHPYSTAGFAGESYEDIEETDFAAAEEVEASLLRYTATVWDACGSELHDEREVRVEMPWLRALPEEYAY